MVTGDEDRQNNIPQRTPGTNPIDDLHVEARGRQRGENELWDC